MSFQNLQQSNKSVLSSTLMMVKTDILKYIVLFTLCAEWDSDMASVLVLLHLLTPLPAGRKQPNKMSVREATGHLVKFHKVCQENTIQFQI